MNTEKPESMMRSRMNTALYGARRSAIREFSKLARQTPGCIALTLGEPDRETEDTVSEQIQISLAAKETHYIENNGTLALRTAIADFEADKNGMDYSPDEVIVTAGATEALFTALFGILNPGDEVIVPTLAFVLYEEIIRLCRGVFVPLDTAEDGFQISFEKLQSLVTPRTKAIILNSPNNPTGAVMRREDLEAIAEVIIEHDLYVLSDEIYSELTYQGDHVSIASLPGMRERTLTINGFSKSYAMTGWRLGYICGPQEIVAQMTKIHQFAIMCAPTTSQYAAVEALRNGDADVAKMRESYNQRRRFLMHAFEEMGLKCFEPFGAFYVFPCIKEFGLTSDEFAMRLLEEEHVAVVPGTAFGDCGEGFLRISYAYSIDDLKIALKRLERFIQRLKKQS